MTASPATAAATGSPGRATRLIVALAVVSGLVLATHLPVEPGDALSVRVGLLLTLGIVSVVMPLRFHHGEQTSGFSLIPAVTFTLAVIGVDGAAVVAAGVMALIGTAIDTRSWMKTAFNAAQNVLGAGFGLAVARLVLGGPFAGDVLTVRPFLAVLLGAIAYSLSNLVLVVEVLHRISGDPRRQLHTELVRPTMWIILGDVAGALLLAVLAGRSSVAIVLAVPVFAGIQLSYKGVAADRAARRQAQLLQRISGRLLDGAVDDSAIEDALGTLRVLVQADRVGLVVDGDDGPSWLQPHAARIRATGEPLSVAGPPPVLAVPVRADGVLLGVLGVTGQRGLEDSGEAQLDLLATVAGEIAATLRTRGLLHDLERERGQLAAETSKLTDVLRSASDGIVVLDVDGRIAAWNPAMTKMLGQPVDALGRPWHEVLQLEHDDGEPIRPDGSHPLAGAMRGRHRVEHATAALRRPDGERRWLRCSAALVYSDGRADGVVLVAVDVTREREVEQLRSDFLATVSHELRTPLTPLRGFLEVVGVHGTALGEERLADVVGAMEKQVDRLSDLIGDLLRVAEVDRAATGLVAEAVDLLDVVHGVVDAEAVAPADRGRVVVVGRPVTVVGDEGAARRVVRALVSNGLKHTTGIVTIVVAGDDAAGLVRVQDEGPVVPPSARATVFRPFGRLGNHLHRTQGAGLGLTVARSLTDAMGGRLELACTGDGIGNDFLFALPSVAPGLRTSQSGGYDNASVSRG